MAKKKRNTSYTRVPEKVAMNYYQQRIWGKQASSDLIKVSDL